MALQNDRGECLSDIGCQEIQTGDKVRSEAAEGELSSPYTIMFNSIHSGSHDTIRTLPLTRFAWSKEIRYSYRTSSS
jgi:hypothetical protein